MDLRLTYYANVEDGRLKVIRKQELIEALKNFEGKQVEVTIQRKRKRRSLMQNSYYWGVVVPVVQVGLMGIGYRVDKEQVHDYLKSQFAKSEVANEETGEIMVIQGSTSRMTTSKMMDYFSEITQWAAEYLGVQIPEPNEQIEINLK